MFSHTRYMPAGNSVQAYSRAFYEDPYESGNENRRRNKRRLERELEYQKQYKRGFGSHTYGLGYSSSNPYSNPASRSHYRPFGGGYQGFHISPRHRLYQTPRSRYPGISSNGAYGYRPQQYRSGMNYAAYRPAYRGGLFGNSRYPRNRYPVSRGMSNYSSLYRGQNPYGRHPFSSYTYNDDFKDDDDDDEDDTTYRSSRWADDDDEDWHSRRAGQRQRYSSYYGDDDEDDNDLDEYDTSTYGWSANSYRNTSNYYSL